jgi:ribosomal protein S18 acetylase RimI-like enzyme
MIEVRRAVVADVPELVRLRGVMLAGLNGREPGPGRWQETAAGTLARRLSEPDSSLAAFVVDRPDEPRTVAAQPAGAATSQPCLAACATGVIECRLADPDNPSGEIGYVFNVATDPGYRRRGYSRACMQALLGWYRQREVVRIDLRASPDGEPLYRALGFAPTSSPTMRLRTAG